MATVRELFAKHGVDNATLESELAVLITTAESKNTGIPKDRFDTVIEERNNLRADKSELESELQNLKNKIENQAGEVERLKKIEGEYTNFKETENKREADKWNDRLKVLKVDESDPNYDNVQRVMHKFNINDGLTPEQIKANNNLFETYEEINYFHVIDKEYPDGEKPGKVKSPKDNPFDLKDGIKGAFRDMAEAIRITKQDPALAKKLAGEARSFTVKE